jgi:glutamyl-Q tRNA(Asp) synthetase
MAAKSPLSSPLETGRFAPSPTGPLHFGSLVAALASYLQVRSHGGRWLVRIEDIDPPREVPGSIDVILKQLDDHGLEWDDQVTYQSAHLDRYHEILKQLRDLQLVYYCQCNRQRLKSLGGVYDGKCSNLRHPAGDSALRLAVDKALPPGTANGDNLVFNDQIMGDFQQHIFRDIGDFIIRRRDGLISYQLAVVADDQYQGITQVLRGADLLPSTPRQILLQKCLGFRTPAYLHIPLALNPEGQKLSKQHFAKPLQRGRERENLWHALRWLGQDPHPELMASRAEQILLWGLENWNLSAIPAVAEGIPAPLEL